MKLDDYFMEIAEIAKKRSSCTRRKVGAVFVFDGRIVSTGYNGSPSGTPHCTDEGCLTVDGHCIRSIHAETNGIFNACKAGQSLAGSTVYTTSYPCIRCLSALRNNRIARIVYTEPYPYSDEEMKLFVHLEPHFVWTKYDPKA